MAQDNRSLAHFELTGIPPAPRGLPKIQVAFSIDAEGLLSVEAADLGTSRSQNISVKASSGLSQEEVDKLVQQGELFHQADILRRDLAELKNKAETLVYQTEQAVEAYADFVPPELIAVVQEDTNHLRGLMAGGSDLESLRGAHAQLENSAFELAEALYGDDAETPTIDESPENHTAETDEQTLENS
jgi:molecular chaperone DnaK